MGVENPQLINFMVLFCGTIIGVFWFLSFANGLKSPPKPLKISDRIDIGYISEPTVQAVTVLPEPVRAKKPKKPQASPLQQDCIDSLIALGSKKTEARQVAARVFSEHNVTTIQQFLSEAYAKA